MTHASYEVLKISQIQSHQFIKKEVSFVISDQTSYTVLRIPTDRGATW